MLKINIRRREIQAESDKSEKNLPRGFCGKTVIGLLQQTSKRRLEETVSM